MNDSDLFSWIREHLFTAVVGDVMDKMGFLHQFLPPEIKALRSDMVVLGRAMPVLEADYFGDSSQSHNAAIGQPFGLMFEALDDLKENEVYLCSGASPSYALWGELMSTRAMHLGAVGAVLHGYVRDTRGILRLNYPTFAFGSYAQDQAPRGKVIDYRVPLQIGQVLVQPGDIVFGDRDGVLIIPQAAEKEILELAYEKATEENKVRTAILNGMSAQEAFDKFGIM
jgi:4-hydroxy-4-methyl-2-oxoglutarate aldolase